jgi:uncharacterized membrane protein
MQNSDIIATIGVSLLLIAFFLQNLKVLKEGGLIYLSLNLIGAAVAGYASLMISFMPFVVLECVWGLVALFGLLKLFLSKKSVSRETDSKNN